MFLFELATLPPMVLSFEEWFRDIPENPTDHIHLLESDEDVQKILGTPLLPLLNPLIIRGLPPLALFRAADMTACLFESYVDSGLTTFKFYGIPSINWIPGAEKPEILKEMIVQISKSLEISYEFADRINRYLLATACSIRDIYPGFKASYHDGVLTLSYQEGMIES